MLKADPLSMPTSFIYFSIKPKVFYDFQTNILTNSLIAILLSFDNYIVKYCFDICDNMKILLAQQNCEHKNNDVQSV